MRKTRRPALFSIVEVLDQTTLPDVTLGRLTLALVVVIAVFALRRVLARALLRTALSLASRTATTLDDQILSVMERPLESAIVLIGVALGFALVPLPTTPIDVHRIVRFSLVVASSLVGAWVLFRVIDSLGVYVTQISQQTDSKLDHALVPMLRKLLKFFVGVLVFVVALQNLGYSVTGLVAGLGIGGLALALAAKDTLANVFASITLLVDRPFKVGDWVRSSDFEGVVEEIGFRSTRIRSFEKTLIVVPNNRLMDAVIDNRQAMTARRIRVSLALDPATDAARVRRVLEAIREILASTPGIAPAPQTVRVQELTPGSLEILVVAFTPTTEDAAHGVIRQDCLLRILEALEANEVRLAAPVAGPQAAARRS